MDNQKQTQKNKISEMIESSLDSIRGIADSGTVIGTPVNTVQGTTIIPVSKVSVGFAGGGNDFSGKNGGDGKSIFSGGGGTGIRAGGNRPGPGEQPVGGGYPGAAASAAALGIAGRGTNCADRPHPYHGKL